MNDEKKLMKERRHNMSRSIAFEKIKSEVDGVNADTLIFGAVDYICEDILKRTAFTDRKSVV